MSDRAASTTRRVRRALFVAIASLGALPLPVDAHGGSVPGGPPDPATLLQGWSFDPLTWLPVVTLAVAWGWAVRRVNRAHPRNPVPGRRTAAFVAGLAALLVALDSGIEAYATTLFSAHMVQHLLLTLVAPPLLLLAAPVTLVLRAVGPATRRRIVLPALHSPAVRIASHPIVAWLTFTAVMWATHFSPLFDAALEDELVHRLEHGLFVGSALLFWWPVIAVDPAPRRLGYPVRLVYVVLQMPQNTFLALAIYSAGTVRYAHYATTGRTWGPSPLVDQQIAGGIMWLGGDLLFLAAILALVGVWMRAEERGASRTDRRVDAERAAIREREQRLAARRAAADQPGMVDVSSARYRSGSTFPPDTTATTDPDTASRPASARR